MERQFKLLIGGRLVPGASTMPVINPALGTAFTHAPRANAEQLEEAIGAAKSAFPAWAGLPLEERRRLLLKVADSLEQRVKEFAELLTLEQGKPLAHAEFECMVSVFTIRGMVAHDLAPKTLREDAQSRVVEYRMPLGVVGAITPWNFPMALLMHKFAPALYAGNTLVIKPAPTTPLTTLLFGELCAELLPRGVVNVVTDQNDLGPLLTQHPDVAKIAFTGSTATGRKVMSSAASTIKRVTLELGGNDAALVLDDVDIAQVSGRIFEGAMFNAGQLCMAIKRVYVPDTIYDRFCDALAEMARRTVVGNGMDEGVQMGPIQNAAQFEKVKQFIREARHDGTLIVGGEALDRPGFFIPPTIVRDLGDDASLVREEQFGPVLPVIRYSDVEDAIHRINDSEYGLTSTVWSKDIDRASEIAGRIECGTVWVNKHMDIATSIPFRGAKQSGLGGELAQAGLDEYTQGKIINVALS